MTAQEALTYSLMAVRLHVDLAIEPARFAPYISAVFAVCLGHGLVARPRLGHTHSLK